MDCPDCGASTLPFSIPTELRSTVPDEQAGGALCRECLSLFLSPDPDSPADQPDFQQVSDAFPADADAAVPMALLVGLLENLALHRSEIADLLDRVERAGTDPLLVLDRLARDPSLDPSVDLVGRRRQLEQLL